MQWGCRLPEVLSRYNHVGLEFKGKGTLMLFLCTWMGIAEIGKIQQIFQLIK